jgi:hypothetical protein
MTHHGKSLLKILILAAATYAAAAQTNGPLNTGTSCSGRWLSIAPTQAPTTAT